MPQCQPCLSFPICMLLLQQEPLLWAKSTLSQHGKDFPGYSNKPSDAAVNVCMTKEQFWCLIQAQCRLPHCASTPHTSRVPHHPQTLVLGLIPRADTQPCRTPGCHRATQQSEGSQGMPPATIFSLVFI